MEPGAKVTVIVFMEETWWPSSNTLSECYNNMDVGVPLCTTRDLTILDDPISSLKIWVFIIEVQ